MTFTHTFSQKNEICTVYISSMASLPAPQQSEDDDASDASDNKRVICNQAIANFHPIDWKIRFWAE